MLAKTKTTQAVSTYKKLSNDFDNFAGAVMDRPAQESVNDLLALRAGNFIRPQFWAVRLRLVAIKNTAAQPSWRANATRMLDTLAALAGLADEALALLLSTDLNVQKKDQFVTKLAKEHVNLAKLAEIKAAVAAHEPPLPLAILRQGAPTTVGVLTAVWETATSATEKLHAPATNIFDPAHIDVPAYYDHVLTEAADEGELFAKRLAVILGIKGEAYDSKWREANCLATAIKP